ncbi:MAG: protein kinase [Anaerolineales bacterium]
MADWAGKTLGKVHIENLVARGGMAEIYKGKHKTYGVVAIKVMRGLLEKDPEQLSRFQREAEVVAELKHPNIVQMVDYKVEDDTPCLVMEYIQGPSLATYLKSLHDKKQRLPIGLVASLLKNVASALDYAHSKGIVHRDIKPANVLLRSASAEIHVDEPLPSDVEPVLTDFGLVRLLDSTMHTTTGAVSGTPAYMSPEQARGEKVDKRTDIYSLGIVLYEMLAGGVPFQADTTFGMLMKHINEPPPAIDGISSDLQAILDRTLAKDPSMRYESAGALANEFLAVFNGQTVSPGTVHIAELARKAAMERSRPRPPAEKPSARLLRVGVEVSIVIALAVLLVQFIRNNPNASVGRMRFSDFNINSVMDRVTVTVNTISSPPSGQHYQGWLRNTADGTVRDIGTVRINALGSGEIVFTDPDQQNLLGSFDEVVVSIEPDSSTEAQPTGEIVYSSKFPPLVLAQTREILVSNPNTPDELAPMQGLYYYSGSYINGVISGDPLTPEFVGLVKAYLNGNETTVRARTEELINLIVGDQSEQYKDYNRDGKIDDYDADGYGSLPNGTSLGYLQLTTQAAQSAADAADSTPNVRQYSENIQICVQNMEGWTSQLLPLALELNEKPFGPQMESVIAEIAVLGDRLLSGVDLNGNDLVEPTVGECGADKAYEYGWYMADMPLYIGADKFPPPGR